MISEIFIFLTALTFFFIGRYSMGSSEIINAINKAKKTLHKNKGQVIDYPTAEELSYEGSERQKIDKQQEKLIKEAGII